MSDLAAKIAHVRTDLFQQTSVSANEEDSLLIAVLRELANKEGVSRLLFAGMLGASVLYGIEKFPETLDKCIAALLAYLDSLTM